MIDPLIAIVLGLFAAGAVLVWSAKPQARWRAGRRWLGIFFMALTTGAIAYLFTGMEIARARGVGHFYSVPFGGYAVRDSALLASLACWVGVMFALMAVALRRKPNPPA